MIFGDDKAKTLPPDEMNEPLVRFNQDVGNIEKNKQKVSSKVENQIALESSESLPRNAQKTKKSQKSDLKSVQMEVTDLSGNQMSKNIKAVKLDPKSAHKEDFELTGIQVPKSTKLGVSPDVEIFPKHPTRKKVFKAREGSALEFVRKLRRDALQNPSPAPAKTREQEVSEIGLSMQQRVAATASNLVLSRKKSSLVAGKKSNLLFFLSEVQYLIIDTPVFKTKMTLTKADLQGCPLLK